MFKTVMTLFALLFYVGCFAAFVPTERETVPAQKGDQVATLDISTLEKLKGKKLTMLEKWQVKKMNKRIKAGKFIIPERDELTEGFRALPFFGSFFTLGLVYLIMLFTARDRNALRWASLGLTFAGIAIGVIALISTLGGY